ncbi:MAG TPA: hypothetical protein DEQ43_06555 [Nocardioides bacterium]|uniref:hypothetical protein n=1 Tax=uncultured Nocardioides sp. TaxID=198441 RepID=UPI000EE12ED5|nr:hypothetical protein [uncultured Nocardioides sp.]HCB03896.1 hypothetical protein [Nocardioides sp.]
MRRTGGIAAVVLLTVAWASGCAGESSAGGPASAGPTLAVSESAPSATAAPTPASTPTPSARAPKFDRPFTYAAGLRVKVSAPEPFTPSPWVVPEPGTPLRFDVVVQNHTGKEWNPSQLHLKLTSGFQPAPQIYDAEKGVVARPEDRLPDRGIVRFSVGYWVTDETELALELSPGFGYQAVTISS